LDVTSFQFVCQIFENAIVVAVPEASPFKSIGELVSAAEKNPGKLSYGHLGTGSLAHLAMENLSNKRAIEVVGAAYRGDAALMPDLVSGRLDFAVGTVGSMRTNPVRVLAIFAEQRHPSFPSAPTVTEAGMASLLPGLNGVIAPLGTPEPILAKLEKTCAEVTSSSSFKETMAKFGEPVIYRGRSDFTKAATTDITQKRQIVKQLGLEPQ
jgi:tripartite-type tricarboxylate transporter receptor subunit TctC